MAALRGARWKERSQEWLRYEERGWKERSQEWLRYEERSWKARRQEWLRYRTALRVAMVFYARNLPHWHPEGQALFITWRLYGSLPKEVLRALEIERKNKRQPSAGRAFRDADRLLDRAQSGPLWLKDPRIAKCVVDSLRRGDAKLNQYRLHAFVVMANHVHALLTPQVAVRRITNGIKGVTAREANRILQRSGQHFWQVESYDHWVRDEEEFARIRAYIENNPVAAGLIARAEDWAWSSASR